VNWPATKTLVPSPDGHRSIPLVCERAPEPYVMVSPGQLDFGEAQPGCGTRERGVQLLNTVSTPIHLDGVELEAGTSDAFFLRSMPPPGFEIGLGLAASVTFAYRPEREGEDTGDRDHA
jgi:hypothetical protein